MPSSHGSLLHSVADPHPPPLSVPPHPHPLCPPLCRRSWKPRHHSLVPFPYRTPQKHACRIGCRKSAQEGSGLQYGKARRAKPLSSERKARKGELHHRGDRIPPLPPLTLEDGFRRRAFLQRQPPTPVQIVSIKVSRALYTKASVPFLLQEFANLARRYSQRVLCAFVIAPSPLLIREGAKDMAVFRWLGNLSQTYGASLMCLLGFGYWIQGFRCFPWFAVNFYFKDVLVVDPSTLQIVQNTVNLPMVAKPVYGIVWDSMHIRGARRVQYLATGGALQALSWGFIAILPRGGSSVVLIATLLALSNLGASMVEVANDAIVAECAKKKKSSGELQSFAWFSAAAGGVLGNLVASFALSRTDFKVMFGVFALLLTGQVVKSLKTNEATFGPKVRHVVIKDMERKSSLALDPSNYINKGHAELPPSLQKGPDSTPYPLTVGATEGTEIGRRHVNTNIVNTEPYVEEEATKMPGMWQQFTDLLRLVSQPDILYPLVWFMASYAMIPTLAGNMFYFQTQYLNIDPSIVGLGKVMGQVGLMGGSAVYSRYLKAIPLRKLLVAVQTLLCFCMLFDILLVTRVNVELGIPDGMLVLGASTFVDALNQFKILPFMVLLGQLCPAGSEGSLLALFMSSQCLATIISGYMGVTLASFLHISPSDFSELPMGIFVQSMAALIPIMWISFLPEGRSKVATLRQRQHDGKST